MTPSGSSYREIPLSQDKVALVSAEDYEDVSRWKWYAWWNPSGHAWYAVRSVGGSSEPGRSIRMHRHIMGLDFGDKRQVDHRNHDTLDNRRENLRVATPSQNTQSRGLQSNNSSGHKGVSYRSSRGKWRATITVEGRNIHLGYRDTKEECIALYREASLRHFGEFSYGV
ncbi:MAG: HNH endonuclease [Terriglobia bacterium]|nr:HNH endonuclease [Terriglobia bacterium]